MTKEERAEKWFQNIPEAQDLDMQAKMRICAGTARGMVIIFFAVLTLQLILTFMLGGGELLNRLADFINTASEVIHTRNGYKGIAIVGGLFCLPLIVLPLAAASVFKVKKLKSETAKALNSLNKREDPAPDKKRFSDWKLDIDGTEKSAFSLKEIEYQLDEITNCNSEFMILSPSVPVGIPDTCKYCSFMQACQDETPGLFHFEIALLYSMNDDNAVIYGKDKVSKDEALQIFSDFFKSKILPDMKNYEIVLDMRQV